MRLTIISWHSGQYSHRLAGGLGQTSQGQLISTRNALKIHNLQRRLEVWPLGTLYSTRANMVLLQLSSRNTIANINMAQPSKGIRKSIAKPFPSLPQSKLHLQFFYLQPWYNWKPASCSEAAKLSSAAASAPAVAKEWLPDYSCI